MVRISRTLGIPRKITGSFVSSAAARAGSAEFFDPLTGISPVRALPPLMTNLSIIDRWTGYQPVPPRCMAIAARTLSPDAASNSAALASLTPAAVATMRRALARSLLFFGCTFTIRFP